MSEHAQQLEYASVQPPSLSAGQRRVLIAACCLGACWVGWLLFYWISAPPTGFEDEVFNWPTAIVLMATLGTLCGLILYVLVLLAMHVRYFVRRRGRERAS
jgi:hypothetical protein